MFEGRCEDILAAPPVIKLKGRTRLIFTSPPFPLNRKKRYGNLQGEEYVAWLSSLGPLLRDYLAPQGSIVIELGNAWIPGSPTMSTLPTKALLGFLEAGSLHLCEEFVCFNPARLPSPAEWVTVRRERVKDAFTRAWWMAPTEHPKANNRRILTPYSDSMRRLLLRGQYNAGLRPSEHNIREKTFLVDHGGAIPPNVLVVSNTRSSDPYLAFCRAHNMRPHPARMPEKIAEFFIRFLTQEGDLVMDPFAGSNVTGCVAERLQRKWLSIEAEPEYVFASKARFAKGAV
jgi:site-specific DNA-methyltransferase (cytosine-N4-specific)